MPIYKYEAADRAGKKLTSTLEAQDEAEAKAKLQEMGYFPMSLALAKERKVISLARITTKDLLTFTQELGSLLEAGLPIDRAIFVLSQHASKAPMRVILADVYKNIQRGQALSQALANHPKVFPRLYVNMIRAGEVGGILESVIRRLASFLETSVAFQEELTSALVYPIVLSVVGGMAVIFILLFVIPRFAVMFEGMGQALPTPTLVLLNLSTFLRQFWWMIIGGVTFLVLLVRSYLGTEEGRVLMDNLKLNTPVISGLHVKSMIARFARTLGTLLESGVPILEAIMVSREVVGNSVISEKLRALEEGVRKGRGISAPLKESGVFPSVVVQMIAVGEEAGKLDRTFLTVADRYESESRSLIKRVMALVGPILILLMAAVVGLIVISMLLAVFSINEIPI
ncbi:type II secretion system F family protein [Nitrospirota bacterium]